MGMDVYLRSRARVKKYMKLIRAHVAILDELVHLLAEEQDSIPPEVQLELADAVRHYRAMVDAFASADRRLRAV